MASSTRSGRALKGSRYCLQRYVRLRPTELAQMIVSACPAIQAFRPNQFVWRSPLAEDDYLEYRDDFLCPRALNLQEHKASLRDFWPPGGPQWDGLALLPSVNGAGVLLLEAKAHPAEVNSNCTASSAKSRRQIASAFSEVQAYMGVGSTDWMHGAYQLANRLAFLYFFNQIAKVPAFLALVNFVNDRSHRPTCMAEWECHRLTSYLGLHEDCRMLDRVVAVYPDAL